MRPDIGSGRGLAQDFGRTPISPLTVAIRVVLLVVELLGSRGDLGGHLESVRNVCVLALWFDVESEIWCAIDAEIGVRKQLGFHVLQRSDKVSGSGSRFVVHISVAFYPSVLSVQWA